MLIWKGTQRRFWKLCGLVVCTALLIACSGASAQTQSRTSNPVPASNQAAATPDPDETAAPTPDGKPTPTEPAGIVSIEIGTASGATEFRYDKETLEAPAGSKIRLKFSNNTNPKDEVGHNWVLVQSGQEDSVVANGKAAGDDKDWLNSDDPGIIAHTRLIEGGQSNTVRFDAPPPGTYTYLCTFPDHYAAGQKGTLTIK